MGAMYTTFQSGCTVNACRIASSAEMVFPEPVGAPSSTFSSVWYSVWKICTRYNVTHFRDMCRRNKQNCSA